MDSFMSVHCDTRAKLPIAVPSFVLPGTVADNAFFLSEKVAEIGLCFFEQRACLEYTEKDMPAQLANLPLYWHIHLPIDLPWAQGGEAAAHCALAVVQKTAPVQLRWAVLHPPVLRHSSSYTRNLQESLLIEFMEVWEAKSTLPILLENIAGASLLDISSAFWKENIFICLDIGHMLAFKHEGILQRKDLLERIKLVHWSAPGDAEKTQNSSRKDQHLPLSYLTKAQYTIARKTIGLLPVHVCHMIEVFSWAGVQNSYSVLQQLLECVRGGNK